MVVNSGHKIEYEKPVGSHGHYYARQYPCWPDRDTGARVVPCSSTHLSAVGTDPDAIWRVYNLCILPEIAAAEAAEASAPSLAIVPDLVPDGEAARPGDAIDLGGDYDDGADGDADADADAAVPTEEDTAALTHESGYS